VRANTRRRFHQDGVQQAVEAVGQGTDEAPIESAPPTAFDLAPGYDGLLAKDQVLGSQGCPGRHRKLFGDERPHDLKAVAERANVVSWELAHERALAPTGAGEPIVADGRSVRANGAGNGRGHECFTNGAGVLSTGLAS
jgi:hypothetical protein